MKKAILIFIYLFISFYSFGQWRYDNNWVLGDSVRIDFSNLSNPQFFPSASFNDEACNSLSDSVGNLLFFTSQMHHTYGTDLLGVILNREEAVMENGDSLLIYSSGTNGTYFLNYPGSDSLFYLFTTELHQIGDVYLQIYYNIIDISLDSGRGSVIQKNVLLIDSVTEKMCAIKHGNGRDWWLILHSEKSNEFVKYLIDPSGIHGPYYQNIGAYYLQNVGEITTNKSGNKLCSVGSLSVKDLFDFDRCSGNLFNYTELGSPPYDSAVCCKQYYGCEFSSDGNRLYIRNADYVGVDCFNEIDQYTVNCSNILASKVEIANLLCDNLNIGQLQIASNDKIYVACNYSSSFLDSSYNYLTVINNPDDSGLACNLNLYSLYLGGRKSRVGLPNYANFNLGALNGSECDTLKDGINEGGVNEIIIEIYPNPTNDELTIEVLNGIAPKEIEITNEVGQVLMKLKQTKPNLKLNIKSFSSGIYFVKVLMKDGSVTVRKFVKL